MAIDLSKILHVGIAAQSAALSIKGAKLIKKRRIRTRDIVESGITNIIGIPILGMQSRLANEV